MSNLDDQVASMHLEGAAAGAAEAQPPDEELPGSAGAAGAAAAQQPGSANEPAQQVEGSAASGPRAGAAAAAAAAEAPAERRQQLMALLEQAKQLGDTALQSRLLHEVTTSLLEEGEEKEGTNTLFQAPVRFQSSRSAFAKHSKELRPDKFKGRSDKRSVLVFLDSVETWLLYSGVPDEERSLHGRMMLCDEAEVHFCTAVKGEELSRMSWTEFKEILVGAYGDVDREFAARNKINFQLKQKEGQSVADLARDFKLELGHLVCAPMSTGDQVYAFQNMLRPGLLRDVMVRGSMVDYSSVDELIRMAMNVEAQQAKLSLLSERGQAGRRPSGFTVGKGSDGDSLFGAGRNKKRKGPSGSGGAAGRGAGASSSGAATGSDKKSQGCWRCGDPGHIKRDCPKKGEKKAKQGQASK